jgi:FkbM family methyltransferase
MLKKMIPRPLIRIARKCIEKIIYRNRPKNSSYTCSAESVLQCVISYNKYGGYCVPLTSRFRPAAQKILSGNIWESETIGYITSHCMNGDIIHAGTYFGDFLPALSRSCATEAKVWAFEPNPENYRCALITTQINDLRNVQLRNVGLGAQRGSMFIMTSDESGKPLGGASRIIEVPGENAQNHFVQVEMVKIDDIVPADRNISVLQLDVEGFETQALTGAMATILRCRPFIILETLPDVDVLFGKILPKGYRITGKVNNNSILDVDNR